MTLSGVKHLICIFFAMRKNKRLYPNIFKKEIFYLCPFSLSHKFFKQEYYLIKELL
jgi:hypothetical protein